MQVVYSFWLNIFRKFIIWQPIGLQKGIVFPGAENTAAAAKENLFVQKFICLFFKGLHTDSYPLQRHETKLVTKHSQTNSN
jgi:hypothetical protein